MISIVIPCFNEEGNIRAMYDRLTSVMGSVGHDYELLFVDDGSTDDTLNRLKQIHAADKRVKIIEFARNFGHQPAVCAGLDYADGDAVIMMDADLQHPPELIPEMVRKWEEGIEVVYTVREDAEDISWFKKMTSKGFYRLFNAVIKEKIPENSADFRLMDKKVVRQFRELRERTKFLRGLIAWVGYRQAAVRYKADRRYSGKSKYTLWRMFRFSLDGMVSFSAFPLHISTVFGFAVSLLSFVYTLYVVYIKLFTQNAVPGWASVMVAVLFLGSIQLLSIGIIGGYLNRIYTELKYRPVYIVRNIHDHHSNSDSPRGLKDPTVNAHG